jgi:hypothetical protein
MFARIALSRPLPRAATALALLVLGAALGGCADMSDSPQAGRGEERRTRRPP